jgi:dimethylargininase
MTQPAFPVRSVPACLSALSASPPDPPIDAANARRQHAQYVSALGSLGVEVVALSADDACPDCCFVEDTVVVAGDVALITRPGAPSRRGEVEAIADALSVRVEVKRMKAPATLDGGDCLRVGRTIYVGLSARTNEEGVACLRDVFGPLGYPSSPCPCRGRSAPEDGRVRPATTRACGGERCPRELVARPRDRP